jgi:hypothetical protein
VLKVKLRFLSPGSGFHGGCRRPSFLTNKSSITMHLTTATNSQQPPHDDAGIISLPAAVRELFALSARIQSAHHSDRMSAFYQAKAARPDLYDQVAAAPPEELNEILAELERGKEERQRPRRRSA